MQALVQPRRTRDDVVDILRGLISRGDLSGGERLEEIELAKRMGVSRTPIREALITLESEGWVKAIPNRGVRVIAADQKMVAEVYPILAALESEAVMASGAALQKAAGQLRRINEKLGGEERKPRQHALDSAFHRALVEKCGNPRLLTLIESQWRLAERFDGAGKRGLANHHGSCAEHDEIIVAIEKGEFRRAAELVRDHWHGGIAVVSEWLRG